MSTKVFVGNLSFKTREPDLAKAFEVVGPVKGTNIIARGPRSLGYGFVEFEKPEDAARSVTELNKKEIDGRQVNVELARPRDFTPVAQAQTGGTGAPATGAVPAQTQQRFPRAPRRYPAAPSSPAGAQPQNGAPQGGAGVTATGGAPAIPGQQGAFRGGRGGARGGRGGRFAGQPRSVAPGAPEQGLAGSPGAQGALPSSGRPPRAAFSSQPRRFSHGPRAAQPGASAAAPGEASKSTLFVANLPFIVDDGGLLEIFEGLNVKEAHVVMRPNGHSKGYGFVTFENEADQIKAMHTVDKSIVEGREISVRPSIAPVRRVGGETIAPGVEVPAAVDSTPAAAAPAAADAQAPAAPAPADAVPAAAAEAPK